ncbi:hypothetical protein D3C75_1358560 [compost metagenome]
MVGVHVGNRYTRCTVGVKHFTVTHVDSHVGYIVAVCSAAAGEEDQIAYAQVRFGYRCAYI